MLTFPFSEVVKALSWSTPPAYGVAVLNPDGSLVWWGSTSSTPYRLQWWYDADASYNIEYYCEAIPWTALTDANWRVFRVRYELATPDRVFDKTWAGVAFNNQATDLATVSVYVYS